ncbi:MAG TPA: TetR/AcrR family transcriptional regulator [Mycobacterium sp.]|uniref:TetR/AcrR family transcriptional regulator n=1 Tax=Mycobacterium sp. TaxID=1785 RepID=UPI002D6242A6|nr:TetR/AcrR family transcriptional regulator [Mycobacterium sp.]HZU48565.1 TetR/AcrR family transcriptional regulator [Mycobacterium sp.]
MSPARIYGGMTAEQREAGRRARLIDTAMELMGTRGAADTTVTAVCAKSGVTSRYFYQHFADRDALLRAVAEQLRSTIQDAIVAAIPEGISTPDALAQAPIRALMAIIHDDPRVARILFVESGTEPTLRQLRSELMASFADLVWQQARLHLNIPDSAVKVGELAAILGVGGVFEVLRRWADGELDYTQEQLVEHCAGLLGSLAGYVLADGAAE